MYRGLWRDTFSLNYAVMSLEPMLFIFIDFSRTFFIALIPYCITASSFILTLEVFGVYTTSGFWLILNC